MKALLFFVLATLLAPTFAQTNYQWCTDAKSGRRTYTDQPCRQGEASDSPGFVQKTPEQIEFAKQLERREQELASQKFKLEEDRRALQLREQENARAEANARNQNAQNNRGSSYECRAALRDMEFAEKKGRYAMNTAILKANQACGTSTPLLQEPAPAIIIRNDGYWR